MEPQSPLSKRCGLQPGSGVAPAPMIMPSRSSAFLRVCRIHALVLMWRSVRKRVRASWRSGGAGAAGVYISFDVRVYRGEWWMSPPLWGDCGGREEDEPVISVYITGSHRATGWPGVDMEC